MHGFAVRSQKDPSKTAIIIDYLSLASLIQPPIESVIGLAKNMMKKT